MAKNLVSMSCNSATMEVRVLTLQSPLLRLPTIRIIHLALRFCLRRDLDDCRHQSMDIVVLKFPAFGRIFTLELELCCFIHVSSSKTAYFVENVEEDCLCAFRSTSCMLDGVAAVATSNVTCTVMRKSDTVANFASPSWNMSSDES